MLLIEIEQKLHKENKEAFLEWRKELVGNTAFITMCNEKIKEIYEKVKEEAEYLDTTYRSYVSTIEAKKEWYGWVIERSQARKASLEKELRKWNAELLIAKGKKERTEIDVTRAKLVPVDLILGKSNHGTGARKMYSCPLHTDKSPSMCWYVVQNKVHCFSCGFHGDVIDLIGKTQNCDFKTAVNVLNRY